MRDPFHASMTPQVYATGAATVIAWMLVITLIITPRTFFVGGAGGRTGLIGRRGMISGATGGDSVIGVGSRPWLQKVAALTVAISLTIATADTFKVAQRQYEDGYMDATALREKVVGGLEIQISRVISDVFLWLAQVQTLIRLFPRHKEKVIIKWTGFALIVLDMTFSCLNSFMGNAIGRPRRFVDAIPALSYLFQLALSMLYAAWVLYYSLTKRKYAFYHSMMWNVSLVALLSVVAILTPVVFFITDISNPNVAGWGDYFRWVGAAAASVIVWEWVERIEALEREEKKDGILGREIFDGDEMLDTTPSEEVTWPGHRGSGNRGNGPGAGGGTYTSGTSDARLSGVAHRIGRSSRGLHVQLEPHIPLGHEHSRRADHTALDSTSRPGSHFSAHIAGPTPPPAVASPVSRTDSTSAGSTIYAVRYHPGSEPSPLHRRRSVTEETAEPTQRQWRSGDRHSTIQWRDVEAHTTIDEEPQRERSRSRWPTVSNPFRRRHASPPPEIQQAKVLESTNQPENEKVKTQPENSTSRWDLKSRLVSFAAEQSERFLERSAGRHAEMNLPVTIIPAQPRGRTWSPEVLQSASSPVSRESNAPRVASPTLTFSPDGDDIEPIGRRELSAQELGRSITESASPTPLGLGRYQESNNSPQAFPRASPPEGPRSPRAVRPPNIERRNVN
ncbi:PalH/RIM21-domain-containing protein [Lineolata rhizophorae]|uniref:PalH/RIM21-domain-containing protein n=1 Tax=Lineolata rhizophorae TaxID=578093 RepID=A0A6A6NYK3_9PEZI|nr:PalH/RIM21-domain-containing protein [Lineolata rhizophorae]